jgi:hypothetical protein
MQNIQVRVTSGGRIRWYNNNIGQIFECEPFKDGDSTFKLAGVSYKGILVEDGEIVNVPATKIVEHDGVQYEVPGYATSLSRDGEGSAVYFWEHAPTWTKSNGYYHTPGAGSSRNGVAKPYIPAGNFMVAI